jgi:hypothetical protein
MPRQFNGKQSLFNNCYCDNWISTCKRMKSFPIPYTKINSKWIKDLNIRTKMVKLLEEIIDVGLHDLG